MWYAKADIHTVMESFCDVDGSRSAVVKVRPQSRNWVLALEVKKLE